MLRNLLLILMASFVALSCGNQQTAEQEEAVEQEVVVNEEPVAMTLAEFDAGAETLVGKEVLLEGTVIHVCKHGGQKMFITADDPDVRIKITPGENMAAFDTGLEGSDIKVMGVVEAMESEVAVEEGEEHEEDEDHENHYHKPQYSVKASEYKVKAMTDEG